jgi:hypothetical protein
MRPISSIAFRTLAAGALFALAAPGGSAADIYLKLGDIKGEVSDKLQDGQIEVQSFHWGTTQAAGASNLNSSKSNRHIGGKGGDGVAVSDPGAPGDPKAIAVNDPGADGPKNPKGIPVSDPSSPADKRVAATADLDGDGMPDAARQADKATPLLAAAKLARPLEQGSITVKVPAGQCAVGALYPTAELTTLTYKYEFRDVIITSCAKAGGDRPMEEVSFNYSKLVESPIKLPSK